MEHAELVAALESERLGVADLLESLRPDEWNLPSLCEGWTIRDLAAHLSLTSRISPVTAIVGVLKARGDINRMIGDAARARAKEFSTAELVAQIRETAASTKRPFGATVLDPLIDILVHGQDIARPLSRTRPMPVERVVPALDQVWKTSFYGAPKRFTGIRLVATDADWRAGSGDREIHGPAGELLLVSTGRAVGLAALDGDGLAEATARLGPH